MKKKVLFALTSELHSKIFSPRDEARIAEMCDVIDAPKPAMIDEAFLLEYISQANIIITSWGTVALGEAVVDKAGSLELLTHAAGSIKPVVHDALWARGIRVTSAAAAISFGVAEFCLGLILMGTKRAFWGGVHTREGLWRHGIETFGGPQEIYQQSIGVIGASHVGKHLMRLLKNFVCDVILYDPFCSTEQAAEFGAEKVETLDELFERSMVVNLSAPNTESTHHMIRGSHFEKLSDGALFINTARGAIVHEEEMIEQLRKGRFVACLDVTEPEPPLLDSPLRQLPNVWLTPHEAGTVAQNMLRIGTFVTDEIKALISGKPLIYEVTQDQLANIG